MGADLVPYRLELAKTLGARHAVDVTEGELSRAVEDWTEGRGADRVIVAVGRPESLVEAVDLVRPHGTVFQVGEMEEVTLNPSHAFIRKEITMQGSWYYTSSDWDDMLELHERGLRYRKLVTHTYPVEKAQDAFDAFVGGETGKVVLTYE
jgi:propanol-preferring alcohol dehydrogenase